MRCHVVPFSESLCFSFRLTVSFVLTLSSTRISFMNSLRLIHWKSVHLHILYPSRPRHLRCHQLNDYLEIFSYFFEFWQIQHKVPGGQKAANHEKKSDKNKSINEQWNRRAALSFALICLGGCEDFPLHSIENISPLIFPSPRLGGKYFHTHFYHAPRSHPIYLFIYNVHETLLLKESSNDGNFFYSLATRLCVVLLIFPYSSDWHFPCQTFYTFVVFMAMWFGRAREEITSWHPSSDLISSLSVFYEFIMNAWGNVRRWCQRPLTDHWVYGINSRQINLITSWIIFMTKAVNSPIKC